MRIQSVQNSFQNSFKEIATLNFIIFFIFHKNVTQIIHSYFLGFGDWTNKEGWEIGWKRGTAEVGEREGGKGKEGERGTTEIGEREGGESKEGETGRGIPMSEEGRGSRKDSERYSFQLL